MRNYVKYLLLLALLVAPVAYSQAQVSIGVQIGPSYGVYNAPPVCSYGFYPTYPFGCAPYGYYGPNWFVDGVFIGAGPWYNFYYVHPSFYRPFYFNRGFGFHEGFRSFRGEPFRGDGFRRFDDRDRFRGEGFRSFRGEGFRDERGFRGDNRSFRGESFRGNDRGVRNENFRGENFRGGQGFRNEGQRSFNGGPRGFEGGRGGYQGGGRSFNGAGRSFHGDGGNNRGGGSRGGESRGHR